MKTTLAEALILQKDLMRELKNTQSKIIACNSFKEDVNNIDMVALIEKQTLNREAMIELKCAIREATPEYIFRQVVRLSEKKEEYKSLKKMPTKEGTFVEKGKTTIYNTYFNKKEVLSRQKEIFKEIKIIEKELSDFNNNDKDNHLQLINESGC